MDCWFFWGLVLLAANAASSILALMKVEALKETVLRLSCGSLLGSFFWTVWGLFIRYSGAGEICSANYLSYAGTVMNIYYIISLSVIALLSCGLCLAVILVRK